MKNQDTTIQCGDCLISEYCPVIIPKPECPHKPVISEGAIIEKLIGGKVVSAVINRVPRSDDYYNDYDGRDAFLSRWM